jgi:hypothetical protein
MGDNTGGMKALSSKTRKQVDEEMKVLEEKVLNSTSVDINSLRPQISDKESFDKLLSLINDATQQNMNIATFHERVTALGTGVIKVVKDVAEIAKKLPI